jgi:uncharacterized glyoxalase superfamily protein PhnB
MRTLLAVALLVLLVASLKAGQASKSNQEPSTMKITPLIYAPAIEPELKFWVDQLAFTKTVEVPDGDKLGFVILVHGSAELMIQSTTSMEKDNAAMAEFARPTACLYIEVSDFDDLVKRVAGAPVAVPIRTTFYGMKEIGVRDPGGNIVLFAAPAPKSAAH